MKETSQSLHDDSIPLETTFHQKSSAIKNQLKLRRDSVLKVLKILLMNGIDVSSENMKMGLTELFNTALQLYGSWENTMIALVKSQAADNSKEEL